TPVAKRRGGTDPPPSCETEPCYFTVSVFNGLKSAPSTLLIVSSLFVVAPYLSEDVWPSAPSKLIDWIVVMGSLRAASLDVALPVSMATARACRRRPAWVVAA